MANSAFPLNYSSYERAVRARPIEISEDTASLRQSMESLLERGNEEYFRGRFDDALCSFQNVISFSEMIKELEYHIINPAHVCVMKSKVALGDLNSLNAMKEQTVFPIVSEQREYLSPLFLDAIKHSAMSKDQKKVILTWLQQSGFCSDITMDDVERFDLSSFCTIGTTGGDIWQPLDELPRPGIPAAAAKLIIDEVDLKTSPGEVLAMYEALEHDCIQMISDRDYVGASQAYVKAGFVLDAAAGKGLQLEALRPGLLEDLISQSALCSVAHGDTRQLDRVLRITRAIIPLDMQRISDILKRSTIPVDRKRFCLRLLSHYGYHLDNSDILEIIGTMTGLKIANALYADGRYTEAVHTYTAVLDRVGGAYPPLNLAVIHYNRGSAHVALNQHEAAIHNLQKTLELNPDHEKAKEKLRNLQQMFPESDNETLDSGNYGNNSRAEQSVSLQSMRRAIRSTEAIYYVLGYQPLN